MDKVDALEQKIRDLKLQLAEQEAMHETQLRKIKSENYIIILVVSYHNLNQFNRI